MTESAVPTSDRLLDGLTASIGERGYRDTTVADIVRYARTSKRTFYEHFAGKEQCLIELLRRNNADLIAGIRAAVAPEDDWQSQIRQAVDAYVSHIGARPAITLCWIREAPALGAVARPLHRQVMGDLTELLTTLTASPGFDRAGMRPLAPTTALILLGGLRELTAYVVEDGRDVAEITEPALAAAAALVGG
ncbi:TetR/AcrR family transcriptional regulator [Mycolicibacterium obuense]|uniref:Bacterial regulatory protein, tetR family n=1 Tax=Mycolicibacterium obuense TaxID=1807 RepID=A0A0J6W189_9MYCO|nr:TetR/AcrR family transcriptional regulator [Mycolicibacterium obuense]KKF01677.1 TetR family transcriptional regulator [Mycolicibacterium obuense]KMO77075.1 Bacterial regulatory protein, tetR family [Mycolicibacterium obuense]TDL11528.1 TetR/AcrR family transcriptional regulator [Mycolicibacterium obuense]